jgi:hypothetical protein
MWRQSFHVSPSANDMDVLIDRPLAAIQKQLSWVSYAPVNWRGLVQGFSWGICVFESYLVSVAPRRVPVRRD